MADSNGSDQPQFKDLGDAGISFVTSVEPADWNAQIASQNAQVIRSDFLQGYMWELGRKIAGQNWYAPSPFIDDELRRKVKIAIDVAVRLGDDVFEATEKALLKAHPIPKPEGTQHGEGNTPDF